MGWLFKEGYSRKQLIAERIEGWEHTTDTGVLVVSKCLAHCYRGGVFSGVLWSVWERNTFTKDGQLLQPTERWIACDLLRYERNYGWGYKPMSETMHPYYYSCPLSYLDIVPVERYGGHEKWREGVRLYHAQQTEKRRARKAARASTT